MDRRVRTYPRTGQMSLASLPPLLRSEPALAGLLGHPDAVVACPEPARPILLAALSHLSRPPPAGGRLPDRLDGRPDLRRPGAVPARGRGRAVPGLGDAAVRARQPERGDDGPPARDPLAPARSRPGAGDRRRRGARPAAAPRARGQRDRADRRPARRRGRSGRAAGGARPPGLPPRGDGGAPRRGGPTRRDHRRVPLDRRRTDPHRPVGRRRRPPDLVRGQRPAQHRRPRRGTDLPGARAAAERRGGRAGCRAGGRRAVGPRAVGAPGRGHDLRRHGELAAVAGGPRGAAHRRARRPTPRSC